MLNTDGDTYIGSLLEKARRVFNATNKKSTTTQYLYHLKEYLLWKSSHNLVDTNPNKLITTYLDHQITTHDWSKKLVNVAYSALKKYYEKVEMVSIDRKFFTNLGRYSVHKPTIMTKKQVDQLLNRSDELGVVGDAMLHVGWECALRAGELVTLRGKDFEYGEVTVKILKTRAGKTKTIELTDETWEKIENLQKRRSENKYIFTTRPGEYEIHSNLRRFLPGEWSSKFSAFSQDVLRQKVRYHDFSRHTRLTFFADETKNFMDVLLLSGHSDPKSVVMYFENAKVKIPEMELFYKKKV